MPIAKAKPLKFLNEVRSELRRVVWPTRQEAIRLTTVVVIVSTLVGVYIGALDYILTKVMALFVGG
jgi:preprotein translocase subunit SecE